MGCKQSTPLKEETANTFVASPKKEVIVEATSEVVVAEPTVFTSTTEEEAPAPMPTATTEPAAPTVFEETSAAPEVVAVVEKAKEELVASPAKPTAAKKSRRRRHANKVLENEPIAQSTPMNLVNDENAIVPSVKAKLVVVPEVKEEKHVVAQEEQAIVKRVAFAKRVANVEPVEAKGETPLPPKAKGGKKSKKAQANVREDIRKQMTMAFHRLLTHPEHLEAHLASR